MDRSLLIECKACGAKLSRKAVRCCACGHPNALVGRRLLAAALLLLIGAGAMLTWQVHDQSARLDQSRRALVQKAIGDYEALAADASPQLRCVRATVIVQLTGETQPELRDNWMRTVARDCERAAPPGV